VRFEQSGGLIARRNEGARLAAGDVIISVDDDAEFSDPRIVENVLRRFDDLRIAAVAIPFVNINSDKQLNQSAPDATGHWITNEFIGTAHALRRKEFLEAGGYREVLFHQGEEGDLCIRLLNRGLLVRMGIGAPILHYESPRRSFERINLYGQRNLMLFAWHNVPMPEFALHFCATVANGVLWGSRRGFLTYRLKGCWAVLRAIMRECRRRAPVSRSTYWLYRQLKKRGPLRIEEVAKVVGIST